MGAGSGKVALLLFCALIWTLPTAPAGAATITPVDWLIIEPDKGNSYRDPSTQDFVTSPLLGSLHTGALTGQVWYNSVTNLYTYEFTVIRKGL